MKNFYAPMIMALLCQQTHCMELSTTPSNDHNGYTIVYKDISERPKQAPISETYNALSEQLYNENITADKIQELKELGAELNYKKANALPVIFSFACNYSYQGAENMKKMIALGAALHNIEKEKHTPLTMALKGGYIYSDDKDHSSITQLLIPYENPIVTVYEETCYSEDGAPSTKSYFREQKIRELLISISLRDQNITTIKMLLDLKLVTANRALEEFVKHMKSDKQILDLILAYGPTNMRDLLPQINNATFPGFNCTEFPSTQCIGFLKEYYSHKEAFDKKALVQMRDIQKDINTIVSLLEAHNG